MGTFLPHGSYKITILYWVLLLAEIQISCRSCPIGFMCELYCFLGSPLKVFLVGSAQIFICRLSANGLPHNFPLCSAQPGMALALSKIVFTFLSPPFSCKVFLAKFPNFSKRFLTLPPPPPARVLSLCC